MRNHAVDELGRDLVGSHRATQEAHTHTADLENESAQAGTGNDAERLTLVSGAVVVNADEGALKLRLQGLLLL